MEDKQRILLIRKGNEAFNSGNIALAAEIFKTTEYQDGLIRVGDHYYYEKKQPLLAYGYYRKAKHEPMLNKLSESFIFALKYWLSDDTSKKDESEDETVVEEVKPENGSVDYTE
ncbi:MAG: hypothetical protein ABUK01_14340 [Leptospirales bacterium]